MPTASITPVGALSVATSCREGLRSGLSGPIGRIIGPAAAVCQEQTAASNGVFAFFVGDLPSRGEICCLGVTRRGFEASDWEVKELSRTPNGFGPISSQYVDWQRTKLAEGGDFVLMGDEHVIIVARAAPLPRANDRGGRDLLVEKVDQLEEIGVRPRPPLMWEGDLMPPPTEGVCGSNGPT